MKWRTPLFLYESRASHIYGFIKYYYSVYSDLDVTNKSSPYLRPKYTDYTDFYSLGRKSTSDYIKEREVTSNRNSNQPSKSKVAPQRTKLKNPSQQLIEEIEITISKQTIVYQIRTFNEEDMQP